MDALSYWIAVVALAVGAGLGVVGFFFPKTAARIVRLQADPDPKLPGGFAEFRASYGGLFLGGHAAALAVTIPAARGSAWAENFALGACAVLAAAWAMTAVGRVLSGFLDRTRTGYNVGSAIFEAVLAVMIAAPIRAALAG